MSLNTHTVAEQFTVQWSGSDSGSGVKSYQVQVQVDGGAWQTWQNTVATSATYPGSYGHTYSFRVRAYDQANNGSAYTSAATTHLGGSTKYYSFGGQRVAMRETGVRPAFPTNAGVACIDSATGSGYLMYSEESVYSRFAAYPPASGNATHFICVKYVSGWKYDNNNALSSFTPRSTDILVAAVNFTSDTITDLKGQTGAVYGIAKGYAGGNLTFKADWWNGVANDGEFGVTGSFVTPHTAGNVLTYLHGDHLGSASLATNASGGKVSELRYFPYGETRSGSLPTDRRFTGQRYEAGLGVYDYNARFYDPTLGRFLAADSIVPSPGNPQSLNRYSYVLNNPLRYSDPSGHYSEEEIMQGFGVSTWDEVLALFQQEGGLLSGRWGWLEVLRQAADGDWVSGTTWNIPKLAGIYRGSYQIHRNSQGGILVGSFEHSLFANHHNQYNLVSSDGMRSFTTGYSEMYVHPDWVRHSITKEDRQTVGLDIVSIGLEVGGWVGFFVSGPILPVAGELRQGYLDLTSKNGAIEGGLNVFVLYEKNMGYTSDDLLGLTSLIPGIGIVTDLVDITSHTTGWRIDWKP